MGFLLAFLTASSAASNDIFFSQSTLRKVSPLTKAWALSVASLPVFFGALLIVGIPTIHPQFWPLVCLEAVLMCIAHILYMRALTLGPLSQTQPILALTTVFLVITNPLMTEERITTAGVIGVILVGIGIYATQHPGRDASGHLPGILSPFLEMWRQPGVMSKLGVAVIFSITANIDRLALEAASGTLYLAVYGLLLSILLTTLVLIHRWKYRDAQKDPTLQPPIRKLTIGGSIQAVSVLLHMSALATGLPVPYLIAVKRLSILFTSLWDYFVRKGRTPHWFRLIGVVLVVTGIGLILIYGKT